MTNKKTCELFSVEGLSSEEVTRIAFESGFCKRNSGKIQPDDFLHYFCNQALNGTVSYNDLAATVEANCGVNASRQAYHQRMGLECVKFFKKVLEIVIKSKHLSERLEKLKGLGRYNRILVQDSTILRLPRRLYKTFSGVKNGDSTVCNARIQGVYDLISRQFISFSIDSYSKNDLSSSLDIPAKQGDLIVRDRGYFSIETIKELQKKGVDVVSRYKHSITIFDIETGEEINLLKYLTKHGSMDKIVLAGNNEKFKLRIIAIPASEETANLRRMKAKKESCSKHPSEELLRLMSWTIFVTTIEDPEITFKTFAKIYGLRWRIENIFKTWKSFFNFDKMHNVSEHQLRVLLMARLIMITFIHHCIYRPLLELIEKRGRTLSMMKLMRYIKSNFNVLIHLVDIEHISVRRIQAIIRYCTYDIRKRNNFETNLAELIWCAEPVISS